MQLRCLTKGFTRKELAFVQSVFDDPNGWKKYGIHISLHAGTKLFTMDLVGAKAMAKEFPEEHLMGLSVTIMNVDPREVYLNKSNWNRLPKAIGCEFTNLDDYRAALINHEVAHVLGYGHVRCRKQGDFADVRQQPSKALGGCVPTRNVYLRT